MTEPTLAEKVIFLGRALREARIGHAFGGAIALAYYAEPRATIDVDINVFVPPGEAPAVRQALEPLGVDTTGAPDELIARDGQGRWWWGNNPVDLFFACHGIHAAMAKAVHTVPFGDVRIPILSPEHLVVCKAMFDRAKDWIDIDQVIAATPDLDVNEIRTWLGEMLGHDKRVRRFEAIASS
jgi:hypothetical protein